MSTKINKYLIISVISICLILVLYFIFGTSHTESINSYKNLDTNKSVNAIDSTSDSTHIYSKEFIESALEQDDSSSKFITVSNYEDYSKYSAEDENAGKPNRVNYQGRRINIAITGVDSRLGTTSKHADANHIVSIMIDSGKIEIISIPRDTYVDCGYDDTTGLNKLTVFRALKGRKEYLDEIANIAKLDKIHYYVEFGFSQAIGLIELMGHKNAVSTLRVLRSRTGLGGDDYQRVYNQAQFIKLNILKNWGLMNSFSGDILTRAGLMFVESNLNSDIINDIKKSLKEKNFNENSDIRIKIRPPIPIKYKVFELTDPNVITSLSRKIDAFNSSHKKDTSKIQNIANYVERKLIGDINNAIQSNYKGNTLSKLNIYFEQKAWMQIEDRAKRDSIRDLLCHTLITYYTKRKNINKINYINQYLEIDRNASKLNSNKSNEVSQDNL